MTIEVKRILKPNAVESAEDEMPDRMKSSDISSEIDFLKRFKLKAQIWYVAVAPTADLAVRLSKLVQIPAHHLCDHAEKDREGPTSPVYQGH